MSDQLIGITVVIGTLLLVPIAILLLRNWMTRPSKKQMGEYSRRFLQRLRQPDFPALENHFGCTMPAPLRALYGDEVEFLRSNFTVAPAATTPEAERWFIADYQPADLQSARDAWPGLERLFAFADDGSGNGYLIDPHLPDPPVLLNDHETGEATQTCPSLSEFMRWPRLPLSDA